MNLLFALLAIPFLAVWRGYALSVIWRWFMVPAFGIPALTIPYAIGLSIIVGLLTARATSKRDEEENMVYRFFVAMLGPLLGLGVGWITKSFI